MTRALLRRVKGGSVGEVRDVTEVTDERDVLAVPFDQHEVAGTFRGELARQAWGRVRERGVGLQGLETLAELGP